MNEPLSISVIGLPVHAVTYESALAQCLHLADTQTPRAVSAANTHIAAAARKEVVFGNIMRSFDLILPDGTPLVWVMNAKLQRQKRPPLKNRIYGPYFMKYAIEHAPAGTTHFLFGGSQSCLDELQTELKKLNPTVQIVGALSPPYREWNEEDLQLFSQHINQANADFIWVALGGEKQEKWIINNQHRFNRGVFFAIGDAFELLAGRRRFAPAWAQKNGFTWLYRLIQEPRRMWRRYLKYNSLFLFYLLCDFFTSKENSYPIAERTEKRSDRVNVLGVGVSATSMNKAVGDLLDARIHAQRGYVCVTGVHGIIESQRDTALKKVHNRSLFTMPDGMPTVWMGREQGFAKMGRVYGPDLMLKVFEATSAQGTHPAFTHFLYGATKEMLDQMKHNLEERFPGVRIVGQYAPPFRPLNEQEEQALIALVDEVRPDFFWVGLSTPKQEKFMDLYNDKLTCGIMLGVGAAFPIHAGMQKDAPEWIKSSGFHWLYRLCQEPKRLWRRYMDIVPSYIALSFLQLLGLKKYTIEVEIAELNVDAT